jgi:Spy/CpxP family protein refolding chaperone
MDTNTKNRWQIRVAILAIFIAGFVAGALAINFYSLQQRPSYASGRGRFDRVLNQLDLTSEQKQQVKAIFDDTRSQLSAIRKKSEPEFREVRRQTDERLKAVLTPEQWDRFQQIMSESKGRRGGRKNRDSLQP